LDSTGNSGGYQPRLTAFFTFMVLAFMMITTATPASPVTREKTTGQHQGCHEKNY
jgi:hypothetical protein